ncbi:MAG: imidazole glycerol phosphate synthase subunit HisH [Pseudomonadota bacterium]
MRSIALIDYGSGNVHSAARALQQAIAGTGDQFEVALTADPETVMRADRIVLPGVGHFGDCRAAVDARPGLLDAMEEAVHQRATPFLGICVGMQLLADFGLEDGEHRGFGWIHGQVQAMQPLPGLAIPHMGWNEIHVRSQHPVLAGLDGDAHAYFVHSYVFSPEDEGAIMATSDHGHPFAAAIARDTVFGTQFHPEKSQAVGLKILSNFLAWAP